MVSFYLFGKKENGTWGEDVLFIISDDPTDHEAAIDWFANSNEEKKNQLLMAFWMMKIVTEKYFWWNCYLCTIFLERSARNDNDEELNVQLLGVQEPPCTLLVMDSSFGVPTPIAWESTEICLSRKLCPMINSFSNEEMITDCNQWFEALSMKLMESEWCVWIFYWSWLLENLQWYVCQENCVQWLIDLPMKQW